MEFLAVFTLKCETRFRASVILKRSFKVGIWLLKGYGYDKYQKYCKACRSFGVNGFEGIE